MIVPVFKTGGRQVTLSPVGSTPTRFRQVSWRSTALHNDGVSIVVQLTTRHRGELSQGMKLKSVALDGGVVYLSNMVSSNENIIKLRARRTIRKVSNSVLKKLSDEFYELTILPTAVESGSGYRSVQADVTFSARE